MKLGLPQWWSQFFFWPRTGANHRLSRTFELGLQQFKALPRLSRVLVNVSLGVTLAVTIVSNAANLSDPVRGPEGSQVAAGCGDLDSPPGTQP